MKSLSTYEDWKHCITEICKVPLTQEFVATRLRELRDIQDYNTKKFIGSWGERHRRRVVAWFEQAETELSQKASKTGAT